MRPIALTFMMLTCGETMVQAQESASNSMQSLVACSARVNDADRLKCYDDVVKAMSAEARHTAQKREAEAERIAAADAIAAERARDAAVRKAEAEKKAAFGAEAIEGAPRADADELKQVESSVQETFRDRFDRVVFLLDNGQVWRQTEGANMPPVKAGTPVLIKRGSLGSYRMIIEKIGRTIQVSRMR